MKRKTEPCFLSLLCSVQVPNSLKRVLSEAAGCVISFCLLKQRTYFVFLTWMGRHMQLRSPLSEHRRRGGWWVRWNRLNVQKSLSWANIFCLPSPCVQFHLILFHKVSWGGIIYIFISFYTSPLDISLTPQRKIHSMWKWKINVWKSLYTLKETFLFCLTQTTSSSLVFSSSVWK